jgi:SAM-dependent methyltransferase
MRMGLYRRFIYPRLVDAAMGDKDLAQVRARVVPEARGAVLEIGAGSAMNLPFYTDAVTRLIALDSSPELLRRAREKAVVAPFPVELLHASAEQLPLPDREVDTVVVTWSLCSIPDAEEALSEVRRVLKRDGTLIFAEHGLSPDPRVQAWQNRINPLWRRVSGGCNLNRRIDALIRRAGFSIEELRTDYLPGPRPMTYTYEGFARSVEGRDAPAS